MLAVIVCLGFLRIDIHVFHGLTSVSPYRGPWRFYSSIASGMLALSGVVSSLAVVMIQFSLFASPERNGKLVSVPDAHSRPSGREGEGTGEIEGTVWFDRRDLGLGGSIPFVRIADRVELTIDFKATRVSGPPLLFKQ